MNSLIHHDVLHLFSYLPALAPLGLLASGVVGLLQPGLRPRLTLAASRAATIVSLVVALASGVLVYRYGSLVSPVLGAGGIGLSFRLDPLSAVMLGLIAFLGFFVVQFSRNYLDGDARQGAFLGHLNFTLAGVALLVLSGNLFHLALAWIGTSLALHQLLLFYPDRPGAIMAAHKKFIVARAGDVCLLGAVFLLYRSFHTLDLGNLFIQARSLSEGAVPVGVKIATFLIAGAAFFKSAQFPSHGWLPELMESPTPVSALLHAGIINGGTFLVVRLSHIMVLSAPTLNLMLVVGGFTALFAGAVMITQPCIKTSLAYSSVAHMGFMLFQCGLGAFPLAIMHLVAHSFYKAHAFLASGTAVETAQVYGGEGWKNAPRAQDVALCGVVALAIYAAVSALLGIPLGASPAAVVLGIVFMLGITHLFVHSVSMEWKGQIVARIAVISLGTSASFYGLELLAEHVLGGLVGAERTFNGSFFMLTAGMVLAFVAATVLQLIMPARLNKPRWQAAYVLMKNGLYINTWMNHWLGAARMRSGQTA